MQMTERPRRLRSTPGLRKMVRETRVDASSLIYPMFVTDGSGRVEEIEALPGQNRYTVDMTDKKIEQLLNAGVSSIMLFGIPEHKDELGTQAYAEDGSIQRAVSHIKEHYPEMYVITDVCMCEYTSHGHCGVLCDQYVDNDASLALLAQTALSHVEAGADMVAPSTDDDGLYEVLKDLPLRRASK